MAIANFPQTELRNKTSFSQIVESEAQAVRQDSLVIQLIPENGQWVAIEPYTGMFGEGDTEHQAFADLLDGLDAMRATLEQDEVSLSGHLTNRLQFLRTV